MTTTAYIGLGSNLGNRAEFINKALALLDDLPGIKITAMSSIIETEPFDGPENQRDYLNGVIEISCSLSANDLLTQLQSIENRLGRTRSQKWDSRTIDLDILLFGSEIIHQDSPDLKIPHLQMHHRLFVMIPLTQIAPDLKHPELNLTMKQILDSI